MQPPESGANITVRQDFSGMQVSTTGDLQIAAAEATATAEVQAPYVLAMKYPRHRDNCRQLIHKEVERPRVAETALYHKPVGKDKQGNMQYAVGFSIRFVEAVWALWRNVDVKARTVYEDVQKCVLSVRASDLEANAHFQTDQVIHKTVERKDRRGRTPLGERQNTYGEVVTILQATDDEFTIKFAAQRSKMVRDNVLKLLPRDLLDECREIIDRVNADENAKDPDAARKKLLDAFFAVGVSASQVQDYLDTPIETLTPKALADLRVIYNGLKEAQFTWAEVMAAKNAPAEGAASAEASPAGRKPKLRDLLISPTPPAET